MMAVEGLVSVRSGFAAAETMARLEAAVRARGLTVFARIDHAAGAAEAGMALRPTDLLIFGNARGGTSLMQAVQTTGIDLPLKVLVWTDADDATWVSYNEPNWLAGRHGVAVETGALTGVLDAVTRAAAG
jgi:uncharacterized protein (DUF302 family)